MLNYVIDQNIPEKIRSCPEKKPCILFLEKQHAQRTRKKHTVCIDFLIRSILQAPIEVSTDLVNMTYDEVILTMSELSPPKCHAL